MRLQPRRVGQPAYDLSASHGRRTRLGASLAAALLSLPYAAAGVRAQDVWSEQAVLSVPDATPDTLDTFDDVEDLGGSVDIDGDTAILGGAGHHWNSGSGSAHVFVRNAGTWTHQATLTPDTTRNFVSFGEGVAIEGDVAIVGSPGDGSPLRSGLAYVFRRTGTTWALEQTLAPSDPEHTDGFGTTVSISGTTVLIGAEGSGTDYVDSAFVFEYSGGSWSETQRLSPAEPTDPAPPSFAYDVAIEGDTAMVAGAPLASSSSSDGVVYVYARSGTDWTETAQLEVPDLSSRAADSGRVLALRGDTLWVVSDSEVKVFQRVAGEWVEQAPVLVPDADDASLSVALGDGHAVVSVGRYPRPGTLHVYEGSGANWSLVQSLVPYDSALYNSFFAAAIDGDTVLAGAPNRDTFNGGGYVYHLGSATDVDGDGVDDAQDPCPSDAANDGDHDGLCAGEVLYFSTTNNITLGGVAIKDEDIARFEEATNSYSIYFDGSAMGLSSQDLDAFSIRPDGSILMSFDASSFTLADVGTVKDEDVVLFVPTSLGEGTTTGKFYKQFVGAEHGLTASNADVDGVYEAADGRFMISLREGLTVAGLAIADEDIVRFNPETNDYSVVFDGSDVSLGAQAIDAFNFQSDGSVLLSLADYPEETGLPGLLAGQNHPIHNAFQFVPTSYPNSYGPNTAGTYRPFAIAALNGATDPSLNFDGFFRQRRTSPAIYQAERAFLSDQTRVDSDHAGFYGSGFVNPPVSGGGIHFEAVYGGGGGQKTVRFRNALASGSRTGKLFVNETAQDVTFTATGAWTTWKNTDVIVNLAPGSSNAIRLETTGADLANIDQLEVLTVYQAEAATVGGGALIQSSNGGYTGTGYVNPPSSGGFIEFTHVDGEVGGFKTIRIRNALGSSASRTGRLVVNGVARNLTLASTGSASTWVQTDVIVPLTPGATNTVRIESTGADLADIDQIEIH